MLIVFLVAFFEKKKSIEVNITILQYSEMVQLIGERNVKLILKIFLQHEFRQRSPHAKIK